MYMKTTFSQFFFFLGGGGEGEGDGAGGCWLVRQCHWYSYTTCIIMGELSLFVIIVQHHDMQHIAENVTFGECLSGVFKSLSTSVQLVYNLHCSLV